MEFDDEDDDEDGVGAGDDDVCECYNNTCNIRRHPQRQLQSPWSAPFGFLRSSNFTFSILRYLFCLILS